MSQAMRPSLLLAVATTAAIAVAGCGSSSSSEESASTSASASGAKQGAVLTAAKSSDVGKTILVDSKGDTVYLFEKDDEPDESYCNGGCAKAWPPVTTSGKPQAKGGLDASRLGTFKREDGTTQVTYAGHPLYTYADDQKPGDANGNGLKEFGAEWYALEPSGAKAEEGGES